MVGEFDAVAAGSAHMGMPSVTMHTERFPLARYGCLLFTYSSIPQVGQTTVALLDKYKQFRDEFLPCKVLWYNCVPGDCLLVSTKKPIQTMEDLQGMKVQSMAAEPIKALKLLGAAPVPIGTADRYSALEIGVIDASMEEWNFTWVWKLHEVTKYRTDTVEWFRARSYPSLVNPDAYNKLPEDVRRIFDEVTDLKAMTMQIAQAMVDFNAASKEKVLEYDKKVGNPPAYYLMEAEVARWKEVTKSVNEDYIKELEAKGLPGRAFVEDAIAFAKQYK